MSNKNLPVKIFEKRKDTDERRVEGGGSRNDPKWTKSLDELQEIVGEFQTVMQDVVHDFDDRPEERKFIPKALEVELIPDAIAKSHRAGIKKIFNVNQKSNLIGFRGDHTLLVKIDNQEDAARIYKNISKVSTNKVGLSAIESIEEFRTIIDLNEKNTGSVKVAIMNFHEYELNSALKKSFELYCKENGISFIRTNYAPELSIYRIDNSSQAIIDTVQEFEAVESISFMPEYEVGLDFLDSDELVKVKEPEDGVEYPVIGVLDSGVARNNYTKPWLLEESFSSYPEDLIDPSHGTFVTGVILYGDELEGQTLTGLEGCIIFDATVFPDTKKEKITEDELIENIREAISKNPEIKIWNMSLGTASEADHTDFSHFGQALDNMQEVHNVLICKSAGNCKNFTKGNPKSRIAKSADSIHALVVGSIAHDKKPNDEAEINYPSPFTRIGKGPGNIVKPELVSYGGNAHYDGLKIVKTGVRSFSTDGQVVREVGTSFSTPRISALLATLDMNLHEDFNPILLKALAIHSARYPEGVEMKPNDKLTQMGFGLPLPANEIIYNDENEITLILQDKLIKGEFMEILEFPYPQSLVDEDGNFFGQINITLVGAPILRNQGSEYCQSNLEVAFGTYEEIKDRDTSIPTVLNEYGPAESFNVLREANYSARFKKAYKGDYSTERMLINYGKKYNPIKKYNVDLSEMTPANQRKSLNSERDWFLRVRGLYRDFAEEMAQKDGEELSQEFALIITIKDPTRKHFIYNEVSQLLENRNFNHSNIEIRPEVRINDIS